jgi:hypothetical protein
MIRAVLIAFAFLSVLWFPYPLTLALSFLAACFFPPTALLVGILADLLYWTGGLPTATLAGLLLSGIAFFVQRFIKARIIS